MIRSLPFAPIRQALALSLLAGLVACQGQAPKPTATVSSGGSCAAERAEFAAATDRAGLPPDQPGGPDAFYAGLRRTGATPVAVAQGLATEAARTADQVDRVTSSFATLKACRLDRAEEIRTGVAGGSLPADRIGPLMAAERDGFQREIETARATVEQLDRHVVLLRLVADRVAATDPGVDLKVARAAAAPPPPPQSFVVTAAAPIYAKPATNAAHIANLRRLQRVQGPGGDATAGWVQLTLNDGSAGYVEASVLRPVQANASAQKAAARAEVAREADGDPIASAVLVARVGLPDREQALSSLIDTSAEGLAVAFTTALPAPDEPDTDSAAAPPS
jgi:hypothetical protein